MPTIDGAFIVLSGIAWACAFVAWWYAVKAWRKKDDGVYITLTPDAMDFESTTDPSTGETSIILTLTKKTSPLSETPELFSALFTTKKKA